MSGAGPWPMVRRSADDARGPSLPFPCACRALREPRARSNMRSPGTLRNLDPIGRRGSGCAARATSTELCVAGMACRGCDEWTGSEPRSRIGRSRLPVILGRLPARDEFTVGETVGPVVVFSRSGKGDPRLSTFLHFASSSTFCIEPVCSPGGAQFRSFAPASSTCDGERSKIQTDSPSAK